MLRSIGKGLRLIQAAPAAILILATIMLASGCATAPEPERADPTSYLMPGQSAWFTASIEGNRELVSYLVSMFSDDAEIVLNRIDSFAGNLDLSVARAGTRGTPGISGVALGRFPEGATRYALWRDRGFDRAVSRTESGRTVYFRQADGPLEIAIPDSGIIVISTDSVLAYLARLEACGPSSQTVDREARPEGSVARILASVGSVDGPDFAVAVPDPSQFLSERLNLTLPRFPIRYLSLVATTIESGDTDDSVEALSPVVMVELGGLFALENEEQAVLFSRLGRGFVLAFVRSLGLDSTNLRDTVKISASGTELLFSGILVSAEELAGVVGRLAGQRQ